MIEITALDSQQIVLLSNTVFSTRFSFPITNRTYSASFQRIGSIKEPSKIRTDSRISRG